MTERQATRLKGFLGLCYRAGQVILGQDACVDAVRGKTAALVLLDEGSSKPSQKRFHNACESHGVPLYGMPAGLIAQALGKDGRMAAAVRPGTMARRLLELVRDGTMTDGNPETNPSNDHADIAGVQA